MGVLCFNQVFDLLLLLKEELPSTAPTASTATQDNGGGKTSSPSARLCSCQGTIASPKKGPQRARSFTSVIDRACNMTQFCSTASSNKPANSSSTRAPARTRQQRSKTPRYLSYLRILVALPSCQPCSQPAQPPEAR